MDLWVAIAVQKSVPPKREIKYMITIITPESDVCIDQYMDLPHRFKNSSQCVRFSFPPLVRAPLGLAAYYPASGGPLSPEMHPFVRADGYENSSNNDDFPPLVMGFGKILQKAHLTESEGEIFTVNPKTWIYWPSESERIADDEQDKIPAVPICVCMIGEYEKGFSLTFNEQQYQHFSFKQ